MNQTREAMIQEFYRLLKNEIHKTEEKTILLRTLLSRTERMNGDMPAYLQSPEGQQLFSAAIDRLVQEQFISPVGKGPDANYGLHMKYRVTETQEKDSNLATTVMKCITLPAKVDYYLRNTDDFLMDKPVIEAIIHFLKNGPTIPLTVNERSYQLFGDEKFFRGDDKKRSRGETVLKRLGLNYSDLYCVDTMEPFFSFQRMDFHQKRERKIYIIENKDTFWSFKRNVMDLSSSLDPDMLIYGEGKKIISSFRFVTEYEVHAREDTFFYFGDLDAEGINIFCELAGKYQEYRIIPFTEGYQAILTEGMKRGLLKTPKHQSVREDNIQFFIKAFRCDDAMQIRELLDAGNYIPQEALNASGMKERFAGA